MVRAGRLCAGQAAAEGGTPAEEGAEPSLRARLLRTRDAVVRRAAATLAAIKWAWSSWPGVVLRWVTSITVLSTLLLNVVVVPVANATCIPRIERSVARLLHRNVTLHGVTWVSPPGLSLIHISEPTRPY